MPSLLARRFSWSEESADLLEEVHASARALGMELPSDAAALRWAMEAAVRWAREEARRRADESDAAR